MLSEREKLDEELRFLKESYEIGVITEEEHKNGIKRVETRIKELDEKQEGEVKTEKVEEGEIVKEESIEKEETKPIEEKTIEKIPEEEQIDEQKEEMNPIEEKTIEKINEEEQSEEEKIIEKKEKTEKESSKDISIEEDGSKDEVKFIDPVEAETPEVETKYEEKDQLEAEVEENQKESLKEEQPAIIFEEDKKSNKKLFTYLSLILLLALGSWFFFTSSIGFVGNSNENTLSSIECYSNNDCSMSGKIGVCSNSGTADSVCKYIDDVRVSLKVLNDKDCFNCQTSRIISLLKNFYPNLVVENIELETDEGKRTTERFSLDALPAYIIGPSIVEAHNYDKLSNVFYELDGSFVMKKTVANSNYYFERKEIPKKLDLFLEQDQETTLKTDENLKEFLEMFDGKILFEKHNADSRIVRELGINTFPTFLVNNKIKFSGVQPSDKIRENFCQLNELEGCGRELSKSLV